MNRCFLSDGNVTYTVIQKNMPLSTVTLARFERLLYRLYQWKQEWILT